MRATRLFALILLLPFSASATSDDADDWKLIGRDLLVLAQRERAKAGRESPALQAADPVQARKDLQAMGLKYWDEQQFLEAARRGDRIAVDLFLAAKGLEARNLPPAR